MMSLLKPVSLTNLSIVAVGAGARGSVCPGIFTLATGSICLWASAFVFALLSLRIARPAFVVVFFIWNLSGLETSIVPRG